MPPPLILRFGELACASKTESCMADVSDRSIPPSFIILPHLSTQSTYVPPELERSRAASFGTDFSPQHTAGFPVPPALPWPNYARLISSIRAFQIPILKLGRIFCRAWLRLCGVAQYRHRSGSLPTLPFLARLTADSLGSDVAEYLPRTIAKSVSSTVLRGTT
jgi:hypothetical protein